MKYWMETKMPRRLLSLALSIVMVLSLLPAGAMAEEAESTPLSCTCEVACAETVNADCPVCGTEAGQCAAAQEPEALQQEPEPQPESVPDPEPDPEPNPEPSAHDNTPEGCEACASEARVAAVQALIDALPDAQDITLENAESVVAQMGEIDAAAMLLSEAELAKLDFAKFDAAQARLIELSDQQLTEQPVAYANNIPYLACDSNGQNWETKTCATATVVTGSDTEWSTGWYVVQKYSYIEGRLSISGNVSLILADGYSLDVDGGIDIPFRSTLTIYAQSNAVLSDDTRNPNTGTLTATATESDLPGIGHPSESCSPGTLIINGGYVKAYGAQYGAGIGGSKGSNCIITINGGYIEAQGGYFGAGIGGGGEGGNSGAITINGGFVNAKGGAGGAGIGCGEGGKGGTITITGGRVNATSGGNPSTGSSAGAGIGAGGVYTDIDSKPGSCGTIAITGGIVDAVSQSATPGIGSNITTNTGGTIIISGGIVSAKNNDLTCPSIGIAMDTFSTGENGNPVIFASSISDKRTQGQWSGIIFEGNEGTVYGNQALTENLTIAEGQTLTIPAGVSLTVTEGVTLTNNGTILNNGTINGTIEGNQPPVNVKYKYLDANGTEQSEACTTITAEYLSANSNTLSAGWYVVKDTVTIESRITVSGDVHLILADGCNLTVNGGIGVNEGNSLTIYAQSTKEDTMGRLTAQEVSEDKAGIGGTNASGGSITINGGHVEAKGGTYAAGIGGCWYGSGGTITITGGTVVATAPDSYGEPAGIGGGGYGACGTIKITGGNVNATGCGKGIGGGAYNTAGTIEISGGYVEANGIGTGSFQESHDTSITGGVVVSTSTINQAHKDSWVGIIFEGNDGQVYGNQTLSADLTIPEGKTLTIPENATLTIPEGVTLTNNGNVYMGGGTLSGTLSGDVYYPLTVTNGTASGDVSTYQDTLYVKAGGTVTLTGNNIPDGKAVSGWQSDEVTIEGNSFTMPNRAVSVTAQFADIVASVTVDGTVTNYASLTDAFAAANGKTATITLLADVNIGSNTLTISGGEVTFQSAENQDPAAEEGPASYTITAEGLGTAIQVTSGTFRFNSGTLKPGNDGIIVSGGTLNFQNGTITGNESGASIRLDSGEANISGGTVADIFATGSGRLNISDGEIQYLSVDGATTALSGGSFGQINPVSQLNGKVSDLLADGYAYKIADGGTWVDATNGTDDKYLAPPNGGIQVLPIPVKIETQPEGVSFTYGDTGKKLTVEASSSSSISYQWYQNDEAVDGATDSVIDVSSLDAGTHQFFCRLTCDGYVLDTDTVTVNVAKATVTTPTVESKAYTGSNQKAEVPASDRYTVGKNDGGTDAGSYNVELTLTDSSNYQWDTAGGKTTFRITKADNSWIENPAIEGWKYGETAKTPTGEAQFGTVKVEYKVKDADDTTYSTTVPTSAGSYKACFTVADTDNYAGLSEVKDFTISPKDITVTITPNGGTYGGTITPATAVANDLVGNDQVDVTLTYTGKANDGTDYNSTTAPKKAGTYTVTATISESNYRLTGAVTADFTIARAQAVIIVDPWNRDYTKTYGDAPFQLEGITENSDDVVGVQYDVIFGNDVVSVSDSGKVTIKKAGSATITLSLPESNNYLPATGVDIQIQVEKATGGVTITGDPGKTYDGQSAVLTDTMYTTTDGRAVTVKYAKKGDTNYSTTAPKDAGNYTVRVTQAADTNHLQAEASRDFTITKKAVTITGTTVAASKVYDGKTTAQITSNGTLSANYDGDNLSIVPGVAAYDTKNVGENKTVTFSGFSLSGSAADNYTLTAQPASVKAVITAKPVTLTVIVKDKDFDDTTTAEIDTVNTDDFVTDDDVRVVSGTASFAYANVGDAIPVSFTDFTLTGTDAGNYSVTNPQPDGVAASILATSNYLNLEDAPGFDGQTEIWVDGVKYPVQTDSGTYAALPEEGALLTTFTYQQNASGLSHGNYPTGMAVYSIARTENGATLERITEFDDLLQYSGCSIRITGKRGIRMITSLTKDSKKALRSVGLAGYTLEEYGTVVQWADELSGKSLTIGTGYHNYAYKKGVSDPVFANVGDLTQYTNVLVWESLTDEQLRKDIVMRPYIILSKDGQTVTLYGGTVSRSIGYIAYQNRAVFKPGSAAYKYVWDIIHAVYGDQYDSAYQG